MSLLDIYPGMVGLKLEACRQYHYTVHQLLDQPLFLKKKKFKNQNLLQLPMFPHKTRNIAQIANRSHSFNLCCNSTESILYKPAFKQAFQTFQTFFNLLPCKSCWLATFTQKLPSKTTTSVHLVSASTVGTKM